MDPQKYYECESENLYNVHFPNKLGLSVDEIKKIFSEFGDVAFVKKAGDDYGFRFVKYRTKKEILRCIEGMKNHKTIRLLPKRLKQNNDQRNGQRDNNWTNKRESRDSESNRTPWDQKKSDDGENFRQDAHRTEEDRENADHRSDDAVPTEKAKQSCDDKSQRTSVTVASLGENEANRGTVLGEDLQEEINNVQNVRDIDADDIKPVDSPNQPRVSAETNEACNPESPLIAPWLAASIASTTPHLCTETEETTRSLADLVPEHKPESPVVSPLPMIPFTSAVMTDDDLPKLVRKSYKSETYLQTKNSPTAAETEQITIEARAIVVANIHTDYGVHYILHLFRKHDPICVSPMKIILKQGLRYCVVYVQSPLQAKDIEEKFDNYSLCGKELIVLRAEKLEQHANEL